jgi:hypothetical protein
LYRNLLALRSRHIVPHLSNGCDISASYKTRGDRGLAATWIFPDYGKLTLLANLGADPLSGFASPDSQIIYASEEVRENELQRGKLPAWSVVWFLKS